MELSHASIRQLQADLKSGRRTAVDLAESCLERIEALDGAGPHLNAFVTINYEAIKDAQAADASIRAGHAEAAPLLGIPVSVKDNIEMAGLPATFGSIAAKDHVPNRDAQVITNLRRAGAVIIGKTAMADFGASWFSNSSISGFTKNPFDLQRDSGGSSAGSAVSVATGMSVVSVGGDTGGSIRVPSSFCGLVGFRPTAGKVGTRGIAPLVRRQDTAGPIARSVEDAAILFSVLSGSMLDGKVELSDGSHLRTSVRLGILDDLTFTPDADADVVTVFQHAVAAIAAGGVQTRHLSGLDWLPHLLRDSSLYLLASKSQIDHFLAARRDTCSPASIDEIYSQGAYAPSLDLFAAIALSDSEGKAEAYQKAVSRQRDLRARLWEAMQHDEVDFLIFPTVRVTPPYIDEIRSGNVATLDFPTNTPLASQAGLPSITMPMGTSRAGIPLGLEVVGRRGDDENLLSIASVLEALLGTPMLNPSLSA